ncbi:MAG: phosphatidate cytidylyltransferase [Saprospiraceae bacterium]
MRERVISAILFVIAILLGVFGGLLPFLTLLFVIAIGCLWESLRMLFKLEERHLAIRRILGLLFGLAPFFLSAIHHLNPEQSVAFPESYPLKQVIPILTVLVFLALLLELYLESKQPFQIVAHYLLAMFYVGFPIMFLLDISIENGSYIPMRPMGILLLIWSNDTLAYFAGTFLGKRLLFPRISPKKTWEGTMGGAVGTVLVAWMLSNFFSAYTTTEWILIAICVGMFGTVGDLVESMLKRSVQVKDSGRIMPGHGGFLDRFDSLIFSLPFIWILLENYPG